MHGCSYCTNSSVCESCSYGYYLSTSLQCLSCTTIDGCLACFNNSHCQYCEANYFLDTSSNLCFPCSAMVGCYACTSNITCAICQGGYILNDNQLCQVMRVEAYETITKLKLKSEYIN